MMVWLRSGPVETQPIFDFGLVFEVFQVVLRRLWQLVELGDALGRAVPARPLLIDRLDLLEHA